MRRLSSAIVLCFCALASASNPRLRLERVDLSDYASEGIVRVFATLVELEGQIIDDKSAPMFRLMVDGKAVGRPEKVQRFQGTPTPLDLVLVLESSALYGPQKVAPALPAPPPAPHPPAPPKKKKRRHPRPSPHVRKPAKRAPHSPSPSAEPKIAGEQPLDKVKDAVRELLEALGTRARVLVVDYGGDVTPHPPFRPAPGAIGEVDDLMPDDESGDLRLVDAVRAALRELGKPRPDGQDARKLIVLVSDGLNSQMDRKTFRALGDMAKQSGVPIHSIAFSPIDDRGPLLNLGEISKRSNGTFRWARTAADLQAQIEGLADELNKQYVLTFKVDEPLEGKKLTLACEDLTSNPLTITGVPPRKLAWLRLAEIAVGLLLVTGIALFVRRAIRRPRRTNAPAPNQSLRPVQVAGSPRAFLILISGPRTGERVPLEGVFTIGKGPCSLRILDDPTLSAEHARIRNRVLEDLGSTNGTFVNSRRIDSPTRLEDGDLVRFGNTQVKFRVD